MLRPAPEALLTCILRHHGELGIGVDDGVQVDWAH